RALLVFPLLPVSGTHSAVGALDPPPGANGRAPIYLGKFLGSQRRATGISDRKALVMAPPLPRMRCGKGPGRPATASAATIVPESRQTSIKRNFTNRTGRNAHATAVIASDNTNNFVI